MSPREPTTMITMDMGGAGSASVGGPGAASTSLAWAVSQEGARGVVEVDFERAPRSRRDSRDPAHRRRTQAATVEPPSQERGGEGIHEALFLGFSHLVVLSGSQPRKVLSHSPRPLGTGRKKQRRRRA